MIALKLLAILVASLVMAWLIGGIVAWDFNPGNWTDEGRVFSLIFGGLFAGLAGAVLAEVGP